MKVKWIPKDTVPVAAVPYRFLSNTATVRIIFRLQNSNALLVYQNYPSPIPNFHTYHLSSWAQAYQDIMWRKYSPYLKPSLCFSYSNFRSNIIFRCLNSVYLDCLDPKKIPQLYSLPLLILVEMRGIEPLSENRSPKLSTSVVNFQDFPLH